MAKRIYTVEIDGGKITVSSEGISETVSRELPKTTDWPDGTVTPWTLAIFIEAGFDNCDGIQRLDFARGTIPLDRNRFIG